MAIFSSSAGVISMTISTASQPWEQLPEESGPAYAAFLAYRELGPTRSFAAAARTLGKNIALLRRWSGRHRWRERVWQWEVQQARQAESVVAQHQTNLLRERLDDLDRMGRVCLVFFRRLVHRDPVTGEVTFEASFTPQVALRFLELTLKAPGAFIKPPAEGESEQQPPTDLFGLADTEIHELVALARERANQTQLEKEQADEAPHGDTTEQTPEEGDTALSA
jgi:hypothetical protein